VNEVGIVIEGAQAMALYLFKLGATLGMLLAAAALVVGGWGAFYFRRLILWLKRQFCR
jgi:hypothetical protein